MFCFLPYFLSTFGVRSKNCYPGNPITYLPLYHRAVIGTLGYAPTAVFVLHIEKGEKKREASSFLVKVHFEEIYGLKLSCTFGCTSTCLTRDLALHSVLTASG